MESAEDIGKNGKSQKILENLINFKSHKYFQNFKNFNKTCEIYKIMEKNENVYEKSKSVETLYPHELLYKTAIGRIISAFSIGFLLAAILTEVSKFLNTGAL